MKFVLDTNHLDFFEKNNFIEFDGLLSSQELLDIQQYLPKALAKSMHSGLLIEPLNLDKLLALGHDLWRMDPLFNKMAKKKSWAELAAQLIKRKPVRLGFDQLLPGASLAESSKNIFY